MTQKQELEKELEIVHELKRQIKEAIKKIKEDLPFLGNFRDAIYSVMDNAIVNLGYWENIKEVRIGKNVLTLFQGYIHYVDIDTGDTLYFFKLKCDIVIAISEKNYRPVLLDFKNVKLKYEGHSRYSSSEKN